MNPLLVLAFFMLIVLLLRLRRKVQALEQRLRSLEARAASAAPGALESAAAESMQEVAPPVTADAAADDPVVHLDIPESGRPAVTVLASGTNATALWSLLKRNLFAVAGIGLLLVGFATLLASVSWGNLLGPAARIGLAFAASAALATLGIRLSGRQPLWAQLVQGGAAGLAYLALYVAVTSYGLFSTMVALVGFTAISTWTVWRACREDSKPLAAVGLLGAYAAPVLALTASGSLVLPLSYGLVVSLASLWVSFRRRWMEVASQAYLGAPVLAAVVSLGSHEPLGSAWQQVFLHGYALPFAACAVAWLRRSDVMQREQAPAITWMGLTAALYLMAQHRLLDPPAFSVVIAVASLAIALLGARLPKHEPAVLREAAWTIAALYAASAVVGADFGRAFEGLVLFGQGILMLLATRDGVSRIRAWIARALVVAGAVVAMPFWGHDQAPPWALGLLAMGSLAGSLGMSTAGRREDSTLLVAISGISTLAAANVLASRLWPDSSASIEGVLMLLALALTSVLAVTSVILRTRAGNWNEVLPLVWMPVVFWVFTLLAPASGLERWHALALAGTLLLAVLLLGAYRTRYPEPADDSFLPGVHAVGILLIALLPAIVAYKLEGLPSADGVSKLVASLALLGLASHALLFGSRLHPFRTKHRAVFGPDSSKVRLAAYFVLPAATLLLLVPLVPVLNTATWLVPIAIATALPAWVVAAPVRWHGCTLVGALLVGGLAAVVLAFSLPHAVDAQAWRRAIETVSLSLVWTATGVGSLFLAHRRQDRTMWQCAAAGCVLALLALVAAASSWNFSMLAGSVAIIAIGGLFLLAGYLAPLPPAPAKVSPSNMKA